VLYLYTGRRAMGLTTSPKLVYHDDLRGIAQEFRAIDAFALRNNLRYLLRTDLDFEQGFTPALGREVVDSVLADPRRFRLAHRSQRAALYESAWFP
jgi:hypothetical protein